MWKILLLEIQVDSENKQLVFSTSYTLKDYNKVKVSMNGIEGYYGISNKIYIPNTQVEFDIFNNYGDNAGLSLDYVRVHITITTEIAIYERWKIRLPIINE